MVTRANILLVEDEAGMAKMVSKRLESAGFAVTVEVDGQAGLDRAKSSHPDLIVLDLKLPNLHGYEVCRRLKKDDQYKDIPILLLTGKNEDVDRRKGMECGADAYLTKPYNENALVHLIETLLRYSESEHDQSKPLPKNWGAEEGPK